MKKFALHLSYVGKPYGGWQKQPAHDAPLPSIQNILEAALERLTTEKVKTVASGRTDAGVNAVGQVVHFETQKELSEYSILRALNTFLPLSIRILGVKEVGLDFHSQRSAIKKQYSYYWVKGRSMPAHLTQSATLLPVEIDLKSMQLSLNSIIGKHNFKGFQASGADPGISTIKTILEAQITEVPFGLPGEMIESSYKMFRFRVVGDGFLKQMVRSMAGTLQWVGENKLKPSIFEEILQKPDRHEIGPTIAPEGLWLEKVWYHFPLF